MPHLGIFGLEFEKPIVMFWATILKNDYQLKSALSNLSKCKVSCKTKKLEM